MQYRVDELCDIDSTSSWCSFYVYGVVFFFKQKTAYEMRISDWSSDVCSSDLGDGDRARLLADAGIIRNRLKVDAAIHNAGVIRGLRDSHGGFAEWLDAHAVEDGRPRDKASWVKLFKRTFKFTGGEITGEFLMSLDYLPGAHRPGCPALKRITAARKATPP